MVGKKKIFLIKAAWCKACQPMVPWFTEIAQGSEEDITMEVMDMDKDIGPHKNFGPHHVTMLPTIYWMDEEENVLDYKEGALGKEDFISRTIRAFENCWFNRDKGCFTIDKSSEI